MISGTRETVTRMGQPVNVVNRLADGCVIMADANKNTKTVIQRFVKATLAAAERRESPEPSSFKKMNA